MQLTWGSDVSHPDSKENTMYRKSATFTRKEWKLRFCFCPHNISKKEDVYTLCYTIQAMYEYGGIVDDDEPQNLF